MPRNPFTTYLERYRLKTGFSRNELAFLIGAMDGKNVTRHEQGKRLPRLRTALAYALILEASVEQLYEGLSLEVRDDLKARARGLQKQISKRSKNRLNAQKSEILNRLGSDETYEAA